jgi:hypothetical protein
VEIVRLVEIVVLEEGYSYESASIFPSFAIPKKNRTLRIVTNFTSHSFPIPKIGGYDLFNLLKCIGILI